MFKLKGLTLFELMLALAVASVITMAAISTIKFRSKTVVADQVVIVIQQWLQAAISCYADKQELPSTSDEIKKKLLGVYMPAHVAENNPWGEPYELSFDGKIATVKTLVPGNVAHILQGSLPLASLQASNSPQGKTELSVQAPVPISGDGSAIGFAEIVSGSQEKPYFIPEPACSGDMQPEVFTTPVTFSSGSNAYPIVQVGAYAKASTNEQGQKGWNVFSTLYTVKGAALSQIGNEEYLKYNNILVMTKCTKPETQRVMKLPQVEKFPILFK